MEKFSWAFQNSRNGKFSQNNQIFGVWNKVWCKMFEVKIKKKS